MTLIEMILEAAIKSAGEYEDVRLTHEEANATLELLKEQQEKIRVLDKINRAIEILTTILFKCVDREEIDTGLKEAITLLNRYKREITGK